MPLPMTFQFAGGPIEDRDSAASAFLALGHAASAWARLEQLIDAILIHINNIQFSKKLFDPEHPVSFRKKIKLLKRWFNKHPALAEHTDDIRTITSRLKELAEHRNTYLHSIFEAYDPVTKTLALHSLKFLGDDTFHAKSEKVTLEAIETFADLTIKANRYLWHCVAQPLFTPDAVKRLETSSPPSLG